MTAKRLPTPGGGALAVKVCAAPTCYGVAMVRAGDPLPRCPKCGSERMGAGSGREGVAGMDGAAGAARGEGGAVYRERAPEIGAQAGAGEFKAKGE
ncbi:MAG: hypothetical protein JF614_23215 [Acidobacteria bacterium]|nr:hypothetical protein [Acidobacteriota bacterium]